MSSLYLPVGSSSIALLRLLPFLPPVAIGIFVLFSAFWPQRILFFSAKQRRKFINGQFLQVSARLGQGPNFGLFFVPKSVLRIPFLPCKCISELSPIVTDFYYFCVPYGRSCNSLFFGLIQSSFLSPTFSWHPILPWDDDNK